VCQKINKRPVGNNMNLRDLMTKLDTLAEADDPRAQYDKFKADDARAAAIEQVKKYASIPLNQIPRLANAIDPKTGIIYYGDASREGGDPQPKKMPLKFMSQGDQKPMVDALTAAGLKVVPHEEKGLFGMSSQYAKVDPVALANIDKPQPGPAPAPGPTPGQQKGPQDDIAKLDALTKALEDSLKGQGPMPTPDPVVKPPVPNVVKPPVEKEKTLGQKAGIGAGIAAGGLTGAALGKKYGGWRGAALGGLAGGALGGLGVNALQKDESVEFNSSIAQALTESFGYDFEDEQLDEYSMDQLGKDAGDFGRGAWNGVTLGTGDNIAAGVQSAFGKDTYKQALAKQTAASKEAETRSPWLYGAGNVAGSIAVPVPGGAIAGGLIKGASTAAKVARGGVALGTNLAAQAGVDKVKNASDTKTLGYDPSKYPKTPQEIMAFQKANGLVADGKIGPKTQGMLAKMGLTPATVAEDIKSIQAKLAMIESGQWRLEEDADYRVWLTEDNIVIDDNGNQIVDESVLDAIEWDQARLDELSLGGLGKSLGRGYDAVANVGRNFAGGLKGKDATGNLIKDTEKNFASRMAAPKANGKVRSAAEIARDSTNARGTANMANKAANYVGKNPGKVALGAAALGTAGVAAANALGGDSSTPPEGNIPHTGGGGSETGTTTTDTPATTTDTPATTTDTPTTTPTAGKLTPEQQALIKQIEEVMSHEWGDDKDWIKATGHARVVLDKATKASPEQLAADAKNDAGAPATGTAGTTSSGGAAAPTGTTTPTQTITVPKVPAGTVINKDGVKEGAEDELARWLRIARG
jgi:hypothetical protein